MLLQVEILPVNSLKIPVVEDRMINQKLILKIMAKLGYDA